jgi:hypothetical protein
MKLPAVAIAGAFSGGILLGLSQFFRVHAISPTSVAILITAARHASSELLH